MNLSTRILTNLKLKYTNQPIERVVNCWENFISRKRLERYLDDKREILQSADCFIEGLMTVPFYKNQQFPWIPKLEESYKAILQELKTYNEKSSETKGEWLRARDDAGAAYGPEWKTLGLQDRNNWNTYLIESFPNTVRILQDLKIPSCEVFFAKQGRRSGILPHSDRNNFIITCHLPLEVPEGECFIKVGDQFHYWKNGKACVFDTSIIHSTQNLSDQARYILLLRIWHPDMKPIEVDAMSFIFRYLDSASAGDEEIENFERKEIFMGREQGKANSICIT